MTFPQSDPTLNGGKLDAEVRVHSLISTDEHFLLGRVNVSGLGVKIVEGPLLTRHSQDGRTGESKIILKLKERGSDRYILKFSTKF